MVNFVVPLPIWLLCFQFTHLYLLEVSFSLILSHTCMLILILFFTCKHRSRRISLWDSTSFLRIRISVIHPHTRSLHVIYSSMPSHCLSGLIQNITTPWSKSRMPFLIYNPILVCTYFLVWLTLYLCFVQLVVNPCVIYS